MKNTTFLILLALTIHSLQSQVIPLWQNGAPGFNDRKDEPEEAKEYWVKHVNNPSITVFQAREPNGAAVLIFPGGGHRLLVFDEEGTKTAKYLNTLGVTGIVLKYRLFREEGSPYTIENAREDAVRAMRVIRSKAASWHIDESRIGIMGFSAGGELVNMIAFEDFAGDAAAADPVERKSGTPDFQIQIYPGPLGVPETVPENAIPLFLLASNRDACCSEPIVKLLRAYRKAGAPVEAHIYAMGDHGFNMGDRSEYLSLNHWPERLADWLKDNNFFRK